MVPLLSRRHRALRTAPISTKWIGGEKWTIENNAGVAKGLLTTKQSFGDCQLHLEFAEPKVVSGNGQGRQQRHRLRGAPRYELQVLDSWNNPTYFDGQCGFPSINSIRRW